MIDLKSKYFHMFSNTIPVKGFKRSLICDLERKKYDFIPNSLFDILMDYNGKSINLILEKLNNDEEAILQEYFNFLLKNEYVFLSKVKQNIQFNKKLNFEIPNRIVSSIIDIDSNSKYNWNTFFKELNSLKVVNVQLRFLGNVSIEKFENILKHIKQDCIRHVQIVVSAVTISSADIEKLIGRYPRIRHLIVYGAKENSTSVIFETEIVHSQKMISSCNQCGIINKKFFSVSIEGFAMAQNFNSCLYKKLSIDVNGKVKNCPSMNYDYGNIKDVKLSEIINLKTFKKIDEITKDQIDTCKDCEFRYVCTDCRAYIEKPKDIYSKPLKCGYDPYTNKWEEWSQSPLKRKAIEYYNLQDLVINKD